MTSTFDQVDLEANVIAAYFTSREIVITSSIASISILFYDYILTIFSEYETFWHRSSFQKLSYARPLFLITRYSVFADTGLFITMMIIRPKDIETCRKYFGAASWLFLIGVCAAEGVLSLRTFALWNCRPLIRRILGLLCAAVGISEIFHIMHFIENLKFAPLELGRGCIVIYTDRKPMILGFALVMIYDTIILVLTIIRAFTTHMRIVRYNRSALVITLYRDGVVFYFCLFIVTLANVLVAQYTSLPTSICLIVLQRVAHAIFTSRIMLNLAQVPRITSSNSSYSTIIEAIDTTVTFFGKEAQFGINGELVSLPPIIEEEQEGAWEVEMDDERGERKDE